MSSASEEIYEFLIGNGIDIHKSQLENLRYLNLSGKKISTIPESIGLLTYLQTLNLSDNQITELPESMGKLIRLQSLSLFNNQLKELPESVLKLPELKWIHLLGNPGNFNIPQPRETIYDWS